MIQQQLPPPQLFPKHICFTSLLSSAPSYAAGGKRVRKIAKGEFFMDENRSAGEPRRTSNTRRRRRRRRSMGLLKALLYVAFVIGASILLATYGWTLANDVLALNKEDHSASIVLPDTIFSEQEIEQTTKNEDGTKTVTTVTVTVADMDYVAQELNENGLIEHEWLFKLFSKMTHGNRKLRAGTYTLDTSMDYSAIVNNLGASSGSRATVSVTFTEGMTVDQIFTLMEEKGVAKVEELREMAATHDYAFSFLQDIELGDYRRLEGYLFPDTYEFYLNEDPKTAINKLLVNFDAKFTDDMRAAVAETEYSIRDILTIASMIEKETDGTDEKKIASVIYNRLERPTSETGGFLNIDAAILYGTGDTVVDTAADTPYNTYIHQGLPPGPIANPGMAAIKAAMNPESTSYYFYVLNPETNRHEFSKTYNEHTNLVNKYAGN